MLCINRLNEDTIGKVMLDTKTDVDCTESVADYNRVESEEFTELDEHV